MDSAIRRLLEERVACQLGVISRKQARAMGLSSSAIDRRLASGEWQSIFTGVYRFVVAPRSWNQELIAACLWMGPQGAISHRSAAAWWELDGFGSGVVEMTTKARGIHPPRGLTVHSTSELPASDLFRKGPIEVTTPMRLLIDLGGVCREEMVEGALDSALRKGLVTLDRLGRRLDEMGTKGRPGTAALRAFMAERVGAHHTESKLETKFLRLLRRNGLPLPVAQYQVQVGTKRYRLDFAYPDRKIGIECDGAAHHLGRQALQRDLNRQNALVAAGWVVLRFTWEDLTRRSEWVCRLVAAATVAERA